VNELLRRVLFLPPQASTVAPEIDHLHFFVILVTMFGAAAITVISLFFVVRYRARGGFVPEDPSARPSRRLEIAVVGGLLSLFCLWWAIGFVQYVKIEVPPEGAQTIYVTGKQWMWKFSYPDGEHTISTLYVPAGRPVRLLLTSRDVIHSFFVPDFRIKQDAVPGRYTTAWFTVRAPGVHIVFCAEYCGTGHSTMRAQVVALSPEDYARWLAGARRAAEVPLPRLVAGGPDGELEQHPAGMAGPRATIPVSVDELPRLEPVGLVRTGLAVAGDLGCLRCHTLDGAPHIGPTWAGLFRAVVPLQGGGTVIADEAYLTESMMDPLARVHAGFQPVMPSYHGVLAPAQAAAVIELIKAVREIPARGPLPAGAADEAAVAPPAGEHPIEAAGGQAELPILPGGLPGGDVRRAPPSLRTAAPAVQQGLPPPGLTRNPEPWLPIQVGPPGAPPIVPGQTYGQSPERAGAQRPGPTP